MFNHKSRQMLISHHPMYETSLRPPVSVLTDLRLLNWEQAGVTSLTGTACSATLSAGHTGLPPGDGNDKHVTQSKRCGYGDSALSYRHSKSDNYGYVWRESEGNRQNTMLTIYIGCFFR